MNGVDDDVELPESELDPTTRASRIIARFLREQDETTIDEIRAHLRDEHRLDATDLWIQRLLLDRGWIKRRPLHAAKTTWHRRPPDVVDLDQPPVRT